MTLTIENASFSYKSGRGARKLLQDVSFSAGKGELVAVLGPNGSGKTTLLRCIMGLLRWDRGRSLIDGEDISRMDAKKQWQRMAYVPQSRSDVPRCTVEEMVLLGRGSRIGAFGRPGEEDVQAARRAMEQLGIAELSGETCSELSGGERQLVLIARAIAAEPQILILDEPESNLDFRNQLVIMGAISRLARGGMTCVFNTHYPVHALRWADRALLLFGDGQWRFGDTEETLTEENLSRAFGVRTVIGEIPTPAGPVRDVVALSGDAGAEK